VIATRQTTVSIVIKALNEERYIATAIESALAALDGIHGEVILADSASTDRTVKIAEKYPIKIVSMSRIEDRSCGAGGQLGYQYSCGDYICLIDGDMRLYRGFVAAAIRYLESNPAVAGVGGTIVELEKDNFEYVKRATSDDPDRRPGIVSRLDCGGVYRRTAIESVGYFTNRNLHGAEELELGARLGAKGWTLARIDRPAIDHYGHAGNAFRLLRRRWTSRMAFSMGELLRESFGRPHFQTLFRQVKRELLLLAAVHAWWLCMLATPFIVGGPLLAAGLIATLGLAPFAVMSVRCHSISLGIYSVTAWNVYALGIWPGLLQRRSDPTEWITSTTIREPTSVFEQAEVP
jgi:glycosyltransferase involved in cell wall biosynthesis